MEKGSTVAFQCVKFTVRQRLAETKVGLFKFPDKVAKPELYKLWCNKIKTFRRDGGKDSLKVTNNTYACEFHFNITDINVGAGCHTNTSISSYLHQK